MNPLFVAAAAVHDLCRERGWGFCFIGGLAVLRWGEPRLTRDIDLTIIAGFGAEEPVVDGLLDRFDARIDDARNSPCKTGWPCWGRPTVSRLTWRWARLTSSNGLRNVPLCGTSRKRSC
jgi:hypothetical protein